MMFYCLYYSVTISESKENFKIVCCCLSVIKSIAAPSFSSNFSVKLIYWGMLVFLDKSMPISL